MNRADIIKNLVLLGQVADKVKARIAELRGELETQARAEWEQQGMAPAWTLPGVATCTLGITDATITVSDEKALVAWMQRNRPDEVETIARPREAGLKALIDAAEVDGDIVHHGGDVIPGLTAIPGGNPKGITVRPTAGAKQVLGVEADALLSAIVAAYEEPIGHEDPSA
jgi:hypothetical protein